MIDSFGELSTYRLSFGDRNTYRLSFGDRNTYRLSTCRSTKPKEYRVQQYSKSTKFWYLPVIHGFDRVRSVSIGILTPLLIFTSPPEHPIPSYTLSNLSILNLVSISVRSSSPPHNPVYVSRVGPSTLALVSHYTDTNLYVFSLDLVYLFIKNIKKYTLTGSWGFLGFDYEKRFGCCFKCLRYLLRLVIVSNVYDTFLLSFQMSTMCSSFLMMRIIWVLCFASVSAVFFLSVSAVVKFIIQK